MSYKQVTQGKVNCYDGVVFPQNTVYTCVYNLTLTCLLQPDTVSQWPTPMSTLEYWWITELIPRVISQIECSLDDFVVKEMRCLMFMLSIVHCTEGWNPSLGQVQAWIFKIEFMHSTNLIRNYCCAECWRIRGGILRQTKVFIPKFV